MRILFLHQNFPGQFRHVVNALCANTTHEVIALGEPKAIERAARLCHPRLKRYAYKPPEPPKPAASPVPAPDGHGPHPYLSDVDTQVRRGHTVARALRQLADRGVRPDAVVAHPGWGESLFVKDVFPHAPLLNYYEFYFSADGADVGFDPEYPSTFDGACRLRMRNSIHLLALAAGDAGVAPTQWQRSRFPALHQSQIEVVHEGVDTTVVKPDANATLVLGDLRLSRADPVVTYVARNLEPYRGFHIFMRMLPKLLEMHPAAQVVVVGGDDVSYGRRPPPGQTYREILLKEVGDRLDTSRVHFTGKLPYETYLRVLQVSRAHVYLTYPFVLSWSMLEAMACGCVVVGSRTPPVQEVIEHGRNGLLADFFDIDAMAAQVLEVLQKPEAHTHLSHAARETVVDRYDLHGVCLPAGLDLLQRALGLKFQG